MSKFLLPLIAVAAFALPVQEADARPRGHKHYRHHGYHHHHYRSPVVVYRDYGYRPYYYGYRSYRRPVRYYSDYDYYTPYRSRYYSRPRFSLSFGF